MLLRQKMTATSPLLRAVTGQSIPLPERWPDQPTQLLKRDDL
ncbi:hypothetical protein FHR49_000855 [Xanthomonas campestris]